jgi:hypothetical protein
VTGSVGPDGGALSRLLFAVVGDTRPATIDDTEGYPANVVATVFAGIAALRPEPPMVVATGDYVFASASHGQAAPQLDVYLAARARFPGALFPAMGNHECTGATASNCGPGAADGEPANYAAFARKLLAPIGQAAPYYAIELASPANATATTPAWSAKFVFVAANAWSTAEESWFDAAMARPTTYTFVVRHEPASAATAPGVGPSEAVMARRPYTLAIVGHSHTYRHERAREVLVGNGGAPLSSKDYGFALVSQRADGSGALDVDMIDWQTGLADASFHFAVLADGSATR